MVSFLLPDIERDSCKAIFLLYLKDKVNMDVGKLRRGEKRERKKREIVCLRFCIDIAFRWNIGFSVCNRTGK